MNSVHIYLNKLLLRKIETHPERHLHTTINAFIRSLLERAVDDSVFSGLNPAEVAAVKRRFERAKAFTNEAEGERCPTLGELVERFRDDQVHCTDGFPPAGVQWVDETLAARLARGVQTTRSEVADEMRPVLDKRRSEGVD